MAEARAPVLDRGFGLVQLFVRRHQRQPVFPGPAVVLRVGQFQVFGAHLQRNLDDRAHVREVMAMQHAVLR